MKFDDSKRIIDETKKNENELSILKRLRAFFLNNTIIVKIKPVINLWVIDSLKKSYEILSSNTLIDCLS